MDPLVNQIFDLTPKTNCNECGFARCKSFARAVSTGSVALQKCPYINNSNHQLAKLHSNFSDEIPKNLRVNSSKFQAFAKIILLPASIFDIEECLPRIDCRKCGYESCFLLAEQIKKNPSKISLCLHLENEILWLKPRRDCYDCGYDSCTEFVQSVNHEIEFAVNCPYTYKYDPYISTNETRDHLIAVPANIFVIEEALPGTNCKECEAGSCTIMAARIATDPSKIQECPHLKIKIYWLETKKECSLCGYATCADFIRSVNKGQEPASKCPYAYKNKISNPETEEKRAKQGTIKFEKQKPENILKIAIDENLTLKEKQKFFKDQLRKANDLIKDEGISRDLELIIKNNKDIYEMAHKYPLLEKQINKFSTTYLPMTLDLLNEYLMLESKVLHEEATKVQQKKIAEAIGKAKVVFIKLNDDFFRQISYDIDAQIKAFDDILTIDGLLSDDDFKINKDDDTKEDR